MKFYNMKDVLYGKCNKSWITYKSKHEIQEKHYISKYVLYVYKKVTKITFKKSEMKIIDLGFKYGNTNTTENAVRHLDTKIFIAVSHKISQIKNSNPTNILHK